MAELNTLSGAMGESLTARAKPWIKTMGERELEEEKRHHQAMEQDINNPLDLFPDPPSSPSPGDLKDQEYQRGIQDGGNITRRMMEKAHREQTTQLLRNAAHQRAAGRIQGALTALAIMALIFPVLLHWWSGG